MRLRSLKRHWDRLGRRDPFWAVLTEKEKSGGRWDVAAFYGSGEAEIASVLEGARARGLTVTMTRALDFGCGAGRLTQALASRFEHTDGVDISASMLEMARQHDRHPSRCTYHVNDASDLSLFGDGCFTFVYSTIVLQHIEPRHSVRYMREFLRVLAPGGVLVFQQPSHRAVDEPPASAASSRTRGRLPVSACRASCEAPDLPRMLDAGREMAIRVRVENRSDHVWPALPDAAGRFQLNLANRWLHDDGTLYQRDDARCPLPHDVQPGASVELMLGVHAPTLNARYLLELDMVQEDVGWFAQRGVAALRLPVDVRGGAAALPRRRAPAPGVVAAEPKFSERHPRLFRVLYTTGVRNLYWAGRRTLDRIKHQRDRLVWWTTEHVYDRGVPPLVNWWMNRPFAARMDMHCVPRARVADIIAAGGARIVDVEEERTPGGYQSCRYWVVKRG